MDVVFKSAGGFYPGSYGSNPRYSVLLTDVYNVTKLPNNFVQRLHGSK
jgi:hypothetical protein